MKKLVLVIIFVLASSFATTKALAAPDQFLAKIYTEALGRMPDQSGWSGYANYLSGSCNQAKLKFVGYGIFTSAEFLALGYNNEERLLALYRGAYSREPDVSGFNNFLSLLAGGMTWSDVVDNFFGSSEFLSITPSICNNWYPWGNGPAIDLTTGSTGFTGTQVQLQALLNSTPFGGTVYISQREVIRLTSTLVVPAGVTLATQGNPNPTHYARMARLVAAGNFAAEIVRLGSGAKLEHVWVDGQRGGHTNRVREQVNILVDGNSAGSQVRYVRTSNSKGWSSLLLYGTHERGAACTGALVEFNLITSYSSSHYRDSMVSEPWTDGITNACDSATIRYNQIVDASDVAIVVFRASPGNQSSQVYGNSVLNAGNSAYGALGFDPNTGYAVNTFTGASISENTIWTGSVAHYDIGLYLGTKAWGATWESGSGATMQNNTTGALFINASTGIAVDGMLSATVTGNSLTTNLQSLTCPVTNIAADVSGGHASGTIQGPYTDTSLHGCIGHP